MRAPVSVRQALKRVDKQLDCIWDGEMGRYVIGRRPSHRRMSPSETLKEIHFHVAEDVGIEDLPKVWTKAEKDPRVAPKVEAGEWVGCPFCAERVHGEFRSPDMTDVEKVKFEFPRYWPGGFDAWWAHQMKLEREQNEAEDHETLELVGEDLEEAAWALKKSRDILMPNDATKEEIKESREAIERRKERRLIDKGLL